MWGIGTEAVIQTPSISPCVLSKKWESTHTKTKTGKAKSAGRWPQNCNSLSILMDANYSQGRRVTGNIEAAALEEGQGHYRGPQPQSVSETEVNQNIRKHLSFHHSHHHANKPSHKWPGNTAGVGQRETGEGPKSTKEREMQYSWWAGSVWCP